MSGGRLTQNWTWYWRGTVRGCARDPSRFGGGAGARGCMGPVHHAHGSAAEREDDAVPGGVPGPSLSIPGGAGRTGVCGGGPEGVPRAVPARRHPRRGAARPGSAVVPAGHHRRRPGPGALDPERVAELRAAGIDQPVVGGQNRDASASALSWDEISRFPGVPSISTRPSSAAAIPSSSIGVTIRRTGFVPTSPPTSSGTCAGSAASAI